MNLLDPVDLKINRLTQLERPDDAELAAGVTDRGNLGRSQGRGPLYTPYLKTLLEIYFNGFFPVFSSLSIDVGIKLFICTATLDQPGPLHLGLDKNLFLKVLRLEHGSVTSRPAGKL